MTGITAKRNFVSVPKTAASCGLTLSAAIRRVKTSTGSPSAAIPETVIIGDRGPSSQAANNPRTTASQAITFLITPKFSATMTPSATIPICACTLTNGRATEPPRVRLC